MTSPPEAKAAEGDEGGEDPDPEQREHLTPRAVESFRRRLVYFISDYPYKIY